MKERPLIDLHIHSTASDGSMSPLKIIEAAHRSNLGAIAITDHDTISGSKEVTEHTIPPELKFVTGVEISASPPPGFQCSGSFHILGYCIDVNDPGLNTALTTMKQARKDRNPRIVRNLNEMGIDITFDEVAEECGSGQMGRPHIATILLKKGYVQNINEAFNKYLGKGKPAYVDKYRAESAQAIEIIRNAGGVPVLAHPFLLALEDPDQLEDLIKTMKDTGLMGLEAYYPEHSPKWIDYYIQLAESLELLITGGTDFHGSLKPAVQMGVGKGNLSIPYELYEKLVQNC
jgi:hypothetical protein